MARAFILSHGARVPGEQDTFVPEGKTLSFYSDFDENTFRAIGLAALNAGDIEPTETIVGPAVVTNYYLSAFEDSALAEHLASESSRTAGRPYYVGQDLPDPVWLCSSPDACQVSYPHHDPSCEGALNAIAEDEILTVSCRGVWNEDGDGTREMEGSTDFMDEKNEEAARIVDWLATDPRAAIAYWESLTQATQAILASYVPLREAVDEYYASGGASDSAAVLEARRYLEAYGEEAFFQWFRELDATQQSFLRADTDLGAVIYRFEREALGLGDGGGGDPNAVLAGRIDEQARAIAEATYALTGSADDLDAVAGLATALETIMGDIGAYQQTVGDSAAYSLYEAGAGYGQALALYQEQLDDDAKGVVSAAAGTLAEWAASLVRG